MYPIFIVASCLQWQAYSLLLAHKAHFLCLQLSNIAIFDFGGRVVFASSDMTLAATPAAVTHLEG